MGEVWLDLTLLAFPIFPGAASSSLFLPFPPFNAVLINAGIVHISNALPNPKMLIFSHTHTHAHAHTHTHT